MSAGRLFTAATRLNIQLQWQQIIMKSLDPLRAKKIFIRNKNLAIIRAQISSMQEQVLSVSVYGTINNTEFNNTVEDIDLL